LIDLKPNGGALLSTTDDKEEKRDELIFELIKDRYDKELDKIANFDNKASSLVGFVSIVVGILLGGGTFKLSVIASYYYLAVPYFIGIGVLLVSIFFSLRAYRIRQWRIVPNVAVLLEKYTDRPYQNVLRTNGATMAEAIKGFEKQNKDKADNINNSWKLLIAGLSIVFIFLMIFTFSGAAIQNDS
jgi:hypothetical protein